MTSTTTPDMPTVIEVDGVEYALTSLVQQFGELPIEVRIELFRWYQLGGKIEYQFASEKTWSQTENPIFSAEDVYRIQRIEPEYPWHVLEDWLQWCVIEECGLAWACRENPFERDPDWVPGRRMDSTCLHGIKFERGNLPCKESLRQRPEGV